MGLIDIVINVLGDPELAGVAGTRLVQVPLAR